MGRWLTCAILAASAACAAGDVDLRGRPCADEVCLGGFTCDPVTDRCVATGDPCADEARLLPCTPGDTVCAAGCRVCLDETWGECAVPEIPVAPVLEDVLDLCEGDDATVTWSTVVNVDYEVEFWNTSAWITPTSVGDGTATMAAPLPLPDYRWRIRASTAVGASDWQQSPLFEITAIPSNPSLSTAPNLCEGASATVSWTSSPPEAYTIEFWDGTAWSIPPSVFAGSASSAALAPGSGYKWRLQTSLSQCAADWRVGNEFTVEPAPVLSEIRITTTDDSVSGSWSATQGCQDAAINLARTVYPTTPETASEGDSISASFGLGFNDSSVMPATVYYYRPFVDIPGVSNTPGRLLCAMVGTTSIHPVHVAEGSIAIDGSDNDWQDAPQWPFSYSQRYDESGSSPPLDPRVAGFMRFAWDDTDFFFFISVDDLYVQIDSGDGIQENDGFELYFDMGFERTGAPDTNDFHFILVPDDSRLYAAVGTGSDWDDTLDASALERTGTITGILNDEVGTDTGWTLEGRIPFTLLGTAMTAERTIGFAAWINEDDTDDHFSQHKYEWTPDSLWDTPSTWGIGQF